MVLPLGKALPVLCAGQNPEEEGEEEGAEVPASNAGTNPQAPKGSGRAPPLNPEPPVQGASGGGGSRRDG